MVAPRWHYLQLDRPCSYHQEMVIKHSQCEFISRHKLRLDHYMAKSEYAMKTTAEEVVGCDRGDIFGLMMYPSKRLTKKNEAYRPYIERNTRPKRENYQNS